MDYTGDLRGGQTSDTQYIMVDQHKGASIIYGYQGGGWIHVFAPPLDSSVPWCPGNAH